MNTKQLLAALNRMRVLSSLTKEDREDLAFSFDYADEVMGDLV